VKKILLSAILLAFAVYSAAISGPLFETLATTPVWIIVVVTIGYTIGQFLSSAKWWLLSRASGIDCTLSDAVKAYFMGMFANNFGLGVVGGDLARALLLIQGKPGSKSKAIASVASDRVHGLFSLATLGSIGGVYFYISNNLSINPKFVLFLIGVSVSLLVLWFAGSFLLAMIPGERKFFVKLRELSLAFPKDLKLLFIPTLISFIFHLWQIFLIYLIGRAYHVEIPLEYLLVAIPLVNIVSTLPITWNGLGVRENALAFFLAPLIISNTQAVAFGAIWLFAVTANSALGGIFAFITKDFKSVIKPEAE